MGDTYTDGAGYKIDLVALHSAIKALDQATAYLDEYKKKLDPLASYSMKDLVGGSSPEQNAARQAFATTWDTAAKTLLDHRAILLNSVKSFTDAMHDVYDTYSGAEDGNAAHFESITNR